MPSGRKWTRRASTASDAGQCGVSSSCRHRCYVSERVRAIDFATLLEAEALSEDSLVEGSEDGVRSVAGHEFEQDRGDVVLHCSFDEGQCV